MNTIVGFLVGFKKSNNYDENTGTYDLKFAKDSLCRARMLHKLTSSLSALLP